MKDQNFKEQDESDQRTVAASGTQDEQAKKSRLRWLGKFIKDEDIADPTKMHILAGLNRSPRAQGPQRVSVPHVYAGTVDPVTRSYRRKKNKAARRARRIQRLNRK